MSRRITVPWCMPAGVREGESSTVDIAQAEVNPDPVMPGDN